METVKSRTIVVNLRFAEYDVYIGRAGKGQDGYFGNPHTLSTQGACRHCAKQGKVAEYHDREECLRLYAEYFHDRIERDATFRQRVLALRGKTLGCFCLPQACHGLIMAAWIDEQGE